MLPKNHSVKVTGSRRAPIACSSSARAVRTVDEVLHGIFGDTEPKVLVITELRPGFVDLIESRVLGCRFLVDLERGLVAREHDVARKRLQNCARADQPPQRRRISRIVPGDHEQVGFGAGRLDRSLVLLRQRFPLLDVDVEEELRATLPPARIVVIGRELDESELLVVAGTDLLGRVDGAPLQRGIEVAAGDLLRHDAELGQHLASESGDPELQPAQILDALISLRNQPPIWAPVFPAGN